MSNKKEFNHSFEQFKLLTNRLDFINIKELSDHMQVNVNTCLRYIKRLQKEERDIEDPDESVDYKKSGICRNFNQSKSSIVNLTTDDIKVLKKRIFDDIDLGVDIKIKILKLISNNLIKTQGFQENIKIIEECINDKKQLKVGKLYTHKKNLTNINISPIYFDSEKEELYAIWPDLDSKIRKISIYELDNCKITEEPILDFRDSKFYSDAVDNIDAFGYILRGENETFKVELKIDNYAKSCLLKESSKFRKIIKPIKNPKYQHSLKTTVFKLRPIANFIITNLDHVEIVGNMKFKDSFDKYFNEQIKGVYEGNK